MNKLALFVENNWLPILVGLIGIQILILSKLIFFPYPELFVYPYLTNNGLVPYRDILDQHFPGLMFLPINLDNLGMTTPEVARLWQFGIVLATQVLLFLIVRKLFGSNLKALISNFLFLIWQPFFEGWVLWIDSFLPLLLLPAFYFTYQGDREGKPKDLFWAGLFFGLSILFKQVVIPLSVLTLILLFLRSKRRKNIIWFILGVIPVPILMTLYYSLKGDLNDFLYWTVVFNLTTFSEFGRKAPFLSGLLRVTAVFGFAALALFNKRFRKETFWLVVFLIGSLLSAYARFDFVHFQPALPFAIMLSTIAIFWGWKSAKYLVLFYLFGTLFLLSTFFKGHVGNKIFFFDDEVSQVAAITSELTNPGDKIFVYGTLPHLYQLTKTLPPGNVFVFHFPWFMKVAEDRVLQGIVHDKPKLIVTDRSVEIEGSRLTDFSPKINEYLINNYETFIAYNNYEFLRPKK